MAPAGGARIRPPARPDTARPRDSQVGRLYDAEHLVHRIFDRAPDFPIVEIAGSRVAVPVERRFGSVTAVQTYVDAVLRLNWVRATWERAEQPVRVRARAGNTAAHYESATGVIAVPDPARGPSWAMRELVVLHELAHHLAPTDESPPHGGPFVGRMLELADGVIGPEAAFLLRVTFLDCGVHLG